MVNPTCNGFWPGSRSLAAADESALMCKEELDSTRAAANVDIIVAHPEDVAGQIFDPFQSIQLPFNSVHFYDLYCILLYSL